MFQVLLGQDAASAGMWAFVCPLIHKYLSGMLSCGNTSVQPCSWGREELLSVSDVLSHSKALLIFILWIGPATMLLSLAWRGSGEGFASYSMAKAINQGWTYQVVSRVPAPSLL